MERIIPCEVLIVNPVVSFRRVLKAHPEYWYFLFIPGYLLGFFLMEHLVPSGCDYWVSWCPLDDRIPFCEWFVLPYCLWYPLLLGTGLLLMFRDVPGLRRYAWFMIAGFGFSILFCIHFPNGQDLRPDAFPRENFCTWLLGRIYAADTNTNVLPSMHVIGSAAAVIAVFRSVPNRRWRWPVLIVAVLVTVSTVLVKQHSVLDVLAAFVLCVPLWFLFYGKRK